MTNQEISELIALFDRSTALTMKLSAGDFSLELVRDGGTAATVPAAQAPDSSAAPDVVPAGKWIHAPLVGTFYAAPGPGKPPFVQPGDRVEQGQTVCLIEAMKMMSEVSAPCACIVEEILAEDGALLSYDAPILRYREV